MFKFVLFFVILAAPLQVASQEQQESEADEPERVATSVRSTSIRFSPPSPWLLGFPGWQVAQTKKSEDYQLLRTLEIYAFSSKQTWAEVALAGDDSKKGWVYWGESLDDDRNFKIFRREETEPTRKKSEADTPTKAEPSP